MPACERCWRIYMSQGETVPYSKVVAEQEQLYGPCTPEEQCGEVHLVLDMKDGGRRCRCGQVVEREASDE